MYHSERLTWQVMEVINPDDMTLNTSKTFEMKLSAACEKLGYTPVSGLSIEQNLIF